MNQYLIIWQQADGLTRDLLVYAESEEAARAELERVFDEGDCIVSIELTGVRKNGTKPTR